MTPDLPPPPPWLAPLQGAFGELLRSPLDASTGTLRSRAPEVAPTLVAALADTPRSAAGLRLYHEQYWMRLFTVMQGELPRFARVVGCWRFNRLAERHLTARPPRAPDLARCADGFAAAVLRGEGPWEGALAELAVPAELARQALRMDEAQRHAFTAPLPTPWRPTPAELASLGSSRLRYAPAFRLLREDWAIAGETTLAPHSAPWFWVSYRAAKGTALRRVEPGLARLLTLARRRTFGDTLAAMADDPRAAGRLPAWIQTALASAWWVGVRA